MLTFLIKMKEGERIGWSISLTQVSFSIEAQRVYQKHLPVMRHPDNIKQIHSASASMIIILVI